MNCQQCGAPLAWDGYRPLIVCDYCNSIHRIRTQDESADRIESWDQPGDSNCPRCLQQLTVASMDGLKVEHCTTCRGVLLEGSVFAMLVRKRRANFRGEPSQPAPLDQEQLKFHVNCPDCARAMEVHPYYGPGNMIIDSCSRCRLVWLDCGEISAIEVAPGSR